MGEEFTSIDILRPTRDDRYMITKKWRVFAALSLQGTLGISLFSGSSVVSNFEVKFHCQFVAVTFFGKYPTGSW